MRVFPKAFLFGAATSAFQIEGSPMADGKGPSIWDEFCTKKGAIVGADRADPGCDHYRLWREDVGIMGELGLSAYRFSIAWSRILPDGKGRANQRGLDFYSRLVDELLEAGITPFPTLFHWDLPLALQRDLGGFANRDLVAVFADYADAVARALGDRVKNWITVNEPFEFSCFGHLFGTHAPGLKSPGSFLRVMHHLLMAHGKSVEILRAQVPGASVGPALSWTPVHPMSPLPRDRAAARRAEAFMNYITVDPILKGSYPKEIQGRLFLRPPIREGDMALISKPVDFIGINYYSRERAKANPFMPFIRATVTGKEPRNLSETDGCTAMGWEVYHKGLLEILGILRTKYDNPPVYLTEFGSAWTDEVVQGPEGRVVHDGRRQKYLKEQLEQLSGAIAEGSDLLGCFVWSLMDNFEWAEGLSKRFGLVHVDFSTQERTVKDSGRYYARVARTGELLEDGGDK